MSVEDAVQPAPKSPFLSFFSRKKRINGTRSNDDLKSAGKKSDKHSTRARSNPPFSSEQPATLPLENKKGKKPNNLATKTKSLDVLDEEDPAYLIEALETIGDVQPVVARSVPKHAKVKPSDYKEKSMLNCLFDESVYDSMLSDSLRVCDLLTSHLDDCIVHVRAKSPERMTYEHEDGRDSGQGTEPSIEIPPRSLSSGSSTLSSISPNTYPSIEKKPLKSIVRHDV